MAKKGHRQKKARALRKSNYVGLFTTAPTPATTTAPLKTTSMDWDKELRRPLGAKVTKR